MRRKDREVTDIHDIINIIERCDVCRIGLSRENVPYIVPMNFGFAYDEDKLTLYFHCANEGEKLDIIRENPVVCFEMDCSHKLVERRDAASFTMRYESVMGTGEITVCHQPDEKRRALSLLIKHYVPQREFQFPDPVIGSVTVLKMDVHEVTGKRNM